MVIIMIIVGVVGGLGFRPWVCEGVWRCRSSGGLGVWESRGPGFQA